VIQKHTCQQTHLFKSNSKKLSRTVAVMETTLYKNSCHVNNIITEQLSRKHLSAQNKATSKQNFSILNQGLQAVTGCKLPTNYNCLSQNYTAILHASMTILELVSFQSQTSVSTAEFNLSYLWFSYFPRQLGHNWKREASTEVDVSSHTTAHQVLLPSGMLGSAWHCKVVLICSTRGLQKPQAIVRSLSFPLAAH